MEYKLLKNIAQITMGQSPDSSSYNEEEKGLPFYQGNADFGELYPTARVWCDAPKKIASEGDILISVRAPIGALNYASEDCCIGRGLAAITIKNEAEKNYVYHLLKARKTDLNSKGTGSTFKAIGKSVLEEVQVPVISREQQKISMQLMDTIENVIRQRKKELRLLDELVKARFVELTENVNTVATRMGDIATYINGYAFKPTDWKESGLPIIRIQNLNDATAKYNYFDGEIDSKYLVTAGDVLVSWATHLEAYIWDGNSAWLNQHIFKTVFDKMPVNKSYFVYATEDALMQAFKNAHGFKPTMEHIKRSDFENAIVKLPDIEIQNQFADFVARTNKSKLME